MSRSTLASLAKRNTRTRLATALGSTRNRSHGNVTRMSKRSHPRKYRRAIALGSRTTTPDLGSTNASLNTCCVDTLIHFLPHCEQNVETKEEVDAAFRRVDPGIRGAQLVQGLALSREPIDKSTVTNKIVVGDVALERLRRKADKIRRNDADIEEKNCLDDVPDHEHWGAG